MANSLRTEVDYLWRFSGTGTAAQTMGTIATRAAGIATAIVAAGAGMVMLADRVTRSAAGLYDMSQRTGLLASELGELDYVARQNGTDIQSLEVGLRKMSRVISDARTGSSEATDTLDQLGVSIESLAGLSPSQQIGIFADAISGLNDETEQMAAAQEVFGRGGMALLPVLELGSAGVAEFAAEARDLGVVLSEEAYAAADEFQDELDRLKMQMNAVVVEAIAPFVAGLVDTVDALGGAKALLVAIPAVFTAVTVAMVANIAVVSGMSTAWITLGVAILDVQKFMLANPILLIATAAAAAGIAILNAAKDAEKAIVLNNDATQDGIELARAMTISQVEIGQAIEDQSLPRLQELRSELEGFTNGRIVIEEVDQAILDLTAALNPLATGFDTVKSAMDRALFGQQGLAGWASAARATLDALTAGPVKGALGGLFTVPEATEPTGGGGGVSGPTAAEKSLKEMIVDSEVIKAIWQEIGAKMGEAGTLAKSEIAQAKMETVALMEAQEQEEAYALSRRTQMYTSWADGVANITRSAFRGATIDIGAMWTDMLADMAAGLVKSGILKLLGVATGNPLGFFM